MDNKHSIILIGPLATGKSTVAEKLSELTGYRNYPVDRLKWYYRFQNGYDINQSRKILQLQGFGGLINYAHRYFGVEDLENLLSRFKGIVDLGASDTHCTNPLRCEQLVQLLEEFPNVFLILPYENTQKSIELLRTRLIQRYKGHPFKYAALDSYLEQNEEFVTSMTNQLVAKHVIYSNDRAPYMIAQEILFKSKLFNYERKDIDLPRVS